MPFKFFNGKYILILSFFVFSITLLKIIDHSFNKVVFVSSMDKKGGGFWKGRKSFSVDEANNSIPANLPGPLDNWAGNEAKELVVKSPFNRKITLVLNLMESHDKNPPLIQVSVNGKEIARWEIKPGKGLGDHYWLDKGKRSKYAVVIDGEYLGKKDSAITLRSLKGSWIAMDNITIYPGARWWEIWKHVPDAWAKSLLAAAGLMLVLYWAWFITANRLWIEFAKNSGLVVGSVLVTLISIEFVLRNYFPQPLHETSLRIVYIPDEKIGYRLKPNVKTSIGFNTNNLGMRDYDWYTKRKPKNTFRILCLGDSFTYSITKMEDSYPKYLERFLQNSHKNIEVLNAGGSGYGTKEEFAYLESYGLEFEPDLVILGFYVGNDITDTHPARNLTAVDGTLVTREAADRMSAGKISWEKRKRQVLNDIHLYRLAKIRDYKYLFAYFDDNIRRSVKRMNVRTGKCLRAGPSEQYRKPENYRKVLRESWENTVIYLEKFTNLAKEKNIGLGIALIPSEIQFDHKEAVDLKNRFLASGGDGIYDWKYPQKALMELAKERGWPMFDTLDEMKKRGSGETYYFCRDPHFNGNGNRVFAGVVKDWILKKYSRAKWSGLVF